MTTTLTRSRRAAVIAVAGGVAIVIVAALVFWRVNGEAETPVPYDDAQSAGLLTLCSADGKSVTGGKVSDKPFAAVVLGETALPSNLDPAGAVATLFAYQPREGVATSEFSGNALTATAELADPERPAARVEEDAWTIGDFVTAFPADYDGYVQLRLYLGTPEAGTLSDQPYDTADLRVDGDAWELVRGGTGSCADAESALLP
jgi:hypothetical protein